MNKHNLTRLFTVAFLFLAAAVAVQGQAARAFVASTGSDANDCSRPSPCRNFQRGHDAVVSGGEVVALDSAGYGPLNITKSVTLTGEGVHAAITSTTISVHAVTIDGPGIVVTLRSLHVQSHPTSSAGAGIAAEDFSALHIENCTVRAAYDGLIVVPVPADGTPDRKLFIKDSLFRNNGRSGINLRNFADTGTLSATIERTRMENNNSVSAVGALFERTKVTLRDCLSSGNGWGITAAEGSEINVESCVVANNRNYGIGASTGSTVRVSNSTVTNNGTAGFWNDPGCTFESRQNNTVRGNAAGNTAGVITPISGT